MTINTYKTSVQYTILDRKPIGRRIQISVSNLKFRERYGILSIEETELQALSKRDIG